jgi:hypothetical protein
MLGGVYIFRPPSPVFHPPQIFFYFLFFIFKFFFSHLESKMFEPIDEDKDAYKIITNKNKLF